MCHAATIGVCICALQDFVFYIFVQVGDGTTTVVLLADEFLKEAKPFIEDGVHPQLLIRSYRAASTLVIEYTNFLFRVSMVHYLTS